MSGALAFPVKSAFSYFRRLDDGGADFTRPSVALLGEELPCPDPALPIPAEVIGLLLTVTSNPSEGTFDVSVGEVEFLQFHSDGGSPDHPATASSGTFTFASVGDAGVRGSFNVTMTPGGPLDGTFDAPFCTLW
jgi:hypothetical protein